MFIHFKSLISFRCHLLLFWCHGHFANLQFLFQFLGVGCYCSRSKAAGVLKIISKYCSCTKALVSEKEIFFQGNKRFSVYYCVKAKMETFTRGVVNMWDVGIRLWKIPSIRILLYVYMWFLQGSCCDNHQDWIYRCLTMGILKLFLFSYLVVSMGIWTFRLCLDERKMREERK